MILSLICAASANGAIGIDNHLPWRLPADLKRFKALTLNHPVVMGRKTFESIGKPLPGRTNLVVTNQPSLKASGCLIAHSLEEALERCRDEEEVFVIGGETLYREALPLAGRIYLTRLHQDFEGDRFLFPVDPAIWAQTSREDHQADPENPYAYSFITYERKPDA
ncbi:MAG: dihydrofolate reductase [Candidatus Omnitrophica bacterium]|nr:dihydrofolate reductase [Candidatus Omnitrophota bacterium]